MITRIKQMRDCGGKENFLLSAFGIFAFLSHLNMFSIQKEIHKKKSCRKLTLKEEATGHGLAPVYIPISISTYLPWYFKDDQNVERLTHPLVSSFYLLL